MSCSLLSTNYSQIHLPSGINITEAYLLNCSGIAVSFDHFHSILTLSFNDTTPSQARDNSDIMIPSMNIAFDTTFVWNATIIASPPDKYVHVLYLAPAKTDMGSLLADLKPSCVESDVAGFSNVLPTMFTHSTNETILLTFSNQSEDWTGYILTTFEANLSPGSGTHTIDFLYYLGTGSLEPSPYSNFGGYYLTSTVGITVNSDASISFVGCQPAEAAMLGMPGWFITSRGPGSTVSGMMYYGNDPSIGNVITFSFSGTVVPEFTTLTLLLSFALVLAGLLCVRKRFRQPTQPPLSF